LFSHGAGSADAFHAGGKKAIEVGVGVLLESPLHSSLCKRRGVAQIDERAHYVLGGASRGGGSWALFSVRARRNLVPQLQYHTLGSLLADAGDGREPRIIAGTEGASQLLRSGCEPKEMDGILPHVGENVQRHLAAGVRKLGIGADRNLHFITDAMHVDDHAGGMAGKQRATKMGNHAGSASKIVRASAGTMPSAAASAKKRRMPSS